MSGRIISEEIITKMTATVNVPKRAAATVARSQIFVEFMVIMSGKIVPITNEVEITKAALETVAAAATAEIRIDTEVVVVTVSGEMTLIEGDPTIGAEIEIGTEIGAKFTVPSERILQLNRVT